MPTSRQKSKVATPNVNAPSRKVPRKMTQTRLENIAIYYLQRYASSAENLRRVLLRRADKALHVHGGDREEIRQWIDDLVKRMIRSDVLNDLRYALGRATALRRLGRAPAKIRAQLAAKGVSQPIIDDVLAETAVTDTGEDAALEAALAYARRRRLGPFSEKPDTHDEIRAQNKKHLAALARAGFTYDVARRVMEFDDE